MKITAYKCPDTFEIFEFKSDYDRHRKRYLAERKREQNKQKVIDGYNKIIQDCRDTVKTAHDLEQWIIKNADLLVERSNTVGWRKISKDFKITAVNLNLHYSELCSNSHCKPLDGVENWGRDKNLPLGYPGWWGRAEFYYTGVYDGFFSDLFSGTGFHFGSGGGGDTYYSCGVTLFESEWHGFHEHRIFNLFRQ